MRQFTAENGRRKRAIVKSLASFSVNVGMPRSVDFDAVEHPMHGAPDPVYALAYGVDLSTEPGLPPCEAAYRIPLADLDETIAQTPYGTRRTTRLCGSEAASPTGVVYVQYQPPSPPRIPPTAAPPSSASHGHPARWAILAATGLILLAFLVARSYS